jgi:hypothetical protein
MAGSIFDGLDLGDSLNIFKKTTNTQMGTVKEGVLSPMDVTGDKLKEGVALVKPQDTTVLGTITSYKSSAVSELDGIIGMLSGGLLNTKAITKAIKIGPNGVTLSDDAILSSASSEMGVPVSGKTSAMRKLASMVTGEFKSLTGVNINGIITTDGNGYRINSNWRTSVGRETLAMINKFTGINEFIDTSVQYAMYNSVMKMAAGLGMSDSYKSIYDLYKDRRTAQQIMVDTVRTMIARGDIVSIDAVLALLDQAGINAVNAGYPEFIKTLFRSFKFDDDVYPGDYPALRDKLLSVLSRVCGPNWWMTYTQFGEAYDLALINTASADMITLLSTVEDLIPMIATAGMFIEQSAVTELKRSLKNAPVYTK